MRLPGALMAAMLGSIATASSARAGDLMVGADASQLLGGSLLYDQVTIAGTLGVKPYDEAKRTGGYLELRARRITIEATGLIEASDAGHMGTIASGSGQGPGGTPLPALLQRQPAGGGAHIGAGGHGVRPNCSLYPGAEGGTPYDDPADPLGFMGLGSSGGASHAGPPNIGTRQRGGNGGGVIKLVTAELMLSGEIRADGSPGSTLYSAASGGGSGGTIWIIAPSFSFDADARLSARGGAGVMSVATGIVGGAGGGGLIRLEVGGDTAALDVDVGGGTAATCSLESAGSDGALLVVAPGCVDADEDGAESDSCGGSDCNDALTVIGPEGTELCNAIDDDCDGDIDEAEAPTLCPVGSGEVCVDGACEPPEGAGGAAAAEPPHIELVGGLCAWHGRPSHGWALLLAALALVLRRQRSVTTSESSSTE